MSAAENIDPNSDLALDIESERGDRQVPRRSVRASGAGRVLAFVLTVQAILWVAHWLVYETWASFWGTPMPGWVPASVAGLSMSFVAASLVAWRYSHPIVRMLYSAAAVWLGVFNFCFFAACLCWLVFGACSLIGLPVEPRTLGMVFFAFAGAASFFGLANASRIRTTRISVRLSNLPAAWRGRTAALVSDIHLGHVRGRGFLERIVARLNRLQPDIVFIAGDLFDGTAMNVMRVVEPLTKLSPRFGAFFAAGNHEEFGDSAPYLEAIKRTGVRVVNNEKAVADGLQIMGVPHGEASDPERLGTILHQAGLERDRASILISHAPQNLAVVESAGIGLQLSGHTHGGQCLPWTFVAARVHGPFASGLNRFGRLAVLTSTGAGTWGPPMRVGTRSEIVLITFE